MTIVFIGGSRSITRLSDPIRSRLNRLIDRELSVVIGDANGADKAVQSYLDEVGYRNVSVYCSGDSYRNNVGNWPTVNVEAGLGVVRKDRKFFGLKDKAMSRSATHGFMLWDGKSVGTLANVIRLLRYGRSSVVYVSHAKEFVEIRDELDYRKLTACATAEVVLKAEREIDSESAPTLRHVESANLPLF